MTGVIFGRNSEEVKRLVMERTNGKKLPEQLREKGMIVGTSPEVSDQLARLAEAGVQRVMLQWLELDDIDRLEAMASSVLPQLKA
jgi:alkanesulfonate monooxygenase SsuD/methylene tetrahydromethanopterin reductase-like flavin-dependent oxidoreductase (luciferase family)